MVFFGIFLLPALYLLCALYLVFRKWGTVSAKAGLFSLAAYGIALGLGTQMIFSSRSSTAGLGFLFLPTYALVPALLGGSFLFVRPIWGRGVVMTMTLLCYFFIAQQTYLTKKKNEARDIEQQRQSLEITKNSQWVRDLETQQPDKVAQILTERAEQTEDRTVLIPIAGSRLISVELLKKLSKSADLGVALTVVRNPKTPSETLEDIYTHSTYPGYFFTDLSSNSNTPERILIELYEKRNENSGIEKGLASNGRLPNQLIPKLLESGNALVLGELARNPKMTCAVILDADKKLESLTPEAQFLSTGKGWAQSAVEKCRSQ